MNDEIKYWLNGLDDLSYTNVLDYITNLQQIEQDHKETNATLMSELAKLEEENERLKEQAKKDNHILGCNFASKDKYKQRYEDYKYRCEKAIEQAKEKIKRYESYINDLKKGNYPSPTIRQERQELIFRIREQKDLLNILQNGSDSQ